MSSIGDVCRQHGQLSQALAAYARAYAVGEELQHYAMLQHSATAMSATYEQQGDDTQALAYFRIAQQYKDSLAFHEQQVAISAIKQQYDFESKEAEIELPTKAKQLAEAQLERRKLIRSEENNAEHPSLKRT